MDLELGTLNSQTIQPSYFKDATNEETYIAGNVDDASGSSVNFISFLGLFEQPKRITFLTKNYRDLQKSELALEANRTFEGVKVTCQSLLRFQFDIFIAISQQGPYRGVSDSWSLGLNLQNALRDHHFQE